MLSQLGGPCRICLVRPAASREHVPPEWFVSRLQELTKLPPGIAEPGGDYTWAKGGETVTKRDGITPRRHSELTRVWLPVCDECNAELNRRFEVPAKPIVREGLLVGRLALDADESAALALWLLKTWMCMGHPDIQHSEPGVDLPSWALDGVDLYGWMGDGSAPPDGLHAWVTRLDSRESEPERTIPVMLPLGGRVLRAAWLFMAAGLLEVTVVYSPHGYVSHPLEAEDRAIRIWLLPPGTELSTGRLPYSVRDEVAWAVSA